MFHLNVTKYFIQFFPVSIVFAAKSKSKALRAISPIEWDRKDESSRPKSKSDKDSPVEQVEDPSSRTQRDSAREEDRGKFSSWF